MSFLFISAVLRAPAALPLQSRHLKAPLYWECPKMLPPNRGRRRVFDGRGQQAYPYKLRWDKVLTFDFTPVAGASVAVYHTVHGAG